MRCFGSLVFLSVVLSSMPAHAGDDLQDPHGLGHVAITGHVGLGTPLGYTGVSLDADLAEWMTLSAGVGMGMDSFSSDLYPQVAAMMRLRIPSGPSNHIDFGVGGSRGAYTWNELTFDEPAHKKWAHANWLNVEIGYEHRFIEARQRWAVRAYAGLGTILNPDDYVCSDDHCRTDHKDDGGHVPYVGVSISHAL